MSRRLIIVLALYLMVLGFLTLSYARAISPECVRPADMRIIRGPEYRISWTGLNTVADQVAVWSLVAESQWHSVITLTATLDRHYSVIDPAPPDSGLYAVTEATEGAPRCAYGPFVAAYEAAVPAILTGDADTPYPPPVDAP